MKSSITRDKKRRELFKSIEEKRLALKILQRMYPELSKEKSSLILSDSETKSRVHFAYGEHSYSGSHMNEVLTEGESSLRIQKYLNELPQNSSRTRIRNRCVLTGRSRSIWRTFRISRIQLRKLALEGILMGVKKASW